MVESPDIFALLVMAFFGFLAGLINVLAGGGSLLTVPALVFAGLNVVDANGTSRIALLAQSVTAMWHFYRASRLPLKMAASKSVVVIGAALFGGYLGTIASDALTRGIFAAAMFVVAALVVFSPQSLMQNNDRRVRSLPKWLAVGVLIVVGIYGGMVQAGTGYLLLAFFVFAERRNLVEANIIKVTIIAFYTPLVIVAFWSAGNIHWQEGLYLGIFQGLGGWLGAHINLRKGAKAIRLAIALMLTITALEFIEIIHLLPD